MRICEIESAGLSNRILKTLETYFKIELSATDPLLDDLEVRDLAGGDWLMHQGDPGDALYLLIRGRLQAWAQDAEGNDKGRFLNEIVPGDSVGELSLLTGEPRLAGIQAIRDSLLISLDRESFEKLAQDHPALVLRLAANVAALLQGSGFGAKSSARNLKTITILPLDTSARLENFGRELILELEKEGPTLSLAAGELGSRGAPVESLQAGDAVPESLKNWLQDQENEYRFVVFHCRAANTDWSRFALRQSDMVLLVGDTKLDPAPRKWELEMLETPGSTIARQMLVLLQPSSDQPIRETARWLADRHIDFHIHVREDRPGDLSRVKRIIAGTALGLVLAGGAARGFAHLGVYRAMRELGLPIDWVGGTSIGAIMAAAIASPLPADDTLELVRKSFVDGKPFSDYTIPMMSLVRGRRMERMLREHLDYRIEDLPIPFFCVSCNLDNGSTNLHEHGALSEAVRASAALPGIIPPAIVNRRLAIDGSVVNNLPVDVMRLKPVGRIVAVDLTPAERKEVDYAAVPSPWAVFRGRYLPFSRNYHLPSLSNIMLKATLLGTLERVREQGKMADIVLNPPVRHFGLTEVKSFEKIVQAGYQHAVTELGCWLENNLKR
jgi:predicted acylesterase/phospholipase RssA/CRP-like cAMP-binding protein